MLQKFLEERMALILGASLIITGIIAASAYTSVQSQGNTLAVTGSTKERVSADMAKWQISVDRVVDMGAVASGYAQVSADSKKVETFLKQNGFTDENITISAITNNDYYESYGQNQIRKVQVSQRVTVESKDVDKIETASKGTLALVQQGVKCNPMPPEYMITTLPDLRISLTGKAVEDARKRAEAIAESTGQRVGKMKSAASGVVQVMAPNSTDVSDYGQYDTSTREKDVFVSVRTTFLLK
jgi:hypothetical protein